MGTRRTSETTPRDVRLALRAQRDRAGIPAGHRLYPAAVPDEHEYVEMVPPAKAAIASPKQETSAISPGSVADAVGGGVGVKMGRAWNSSRFWKSPSANTAFPPSKVYVCRLWPA